MHFYYSKGRMISHTQPRLIRITIRGNIVEISVKGINPCDAEFTFLFKVQHHKNSWQLHKPCHVGIHLKALAEHYQMSTNVPGFQPFFNFFSNYFVFSKSPSGNTRVNKERQNWLRLIFCLPLHVAIFFSRFWDWQDPTAWWPCTVSWCPNVCCQGSLHCKYTILIIWNY